MNIYHTYGLNLCSEIPFMDKKIIKGQPDVKISLGKIDSNTCQEIISGNGNWIGKGYSEKEIIISWEDVGKFKISDGSEIVVDADIKDVKTLNLYLLGPVMATLLHQRGFLVLHASAIRTEYGVFAFSGPSGYGKSTIAGLLCNEGYPVIADDILAIQVNHGKFEVVPGFSQLKVSYDVVESFWRIPIIEFELTDSGEYIFNLNPNFSNKLNLKRIYILEKSSNNSITSLTPQESLIKLLKSSYSPSLFLDDDKAKNLHQCAELLKKTDVALLQIQHSFKTIPRLIQMIRDDISDEQE